MRAIVALALALPRGVALAAFASLVLVQTINPNYADFVSYMEGVQRVVTEGSPYTAFQLAGPYPLDQAAGGRGYVYPPSSLPFLMPFAFGTLGGLVLNLTGALFMGVVVLALLEERKPIGWWAVPLLVILAMSPFLYNSVRVGQVTPWLAGLLGLSWLVPKRSGWVSVIAGLVKVYPALGLVWAWRVRATVGWPILAGLGLVLLTVALWPSAWPEWITAFGNAERSCMPWGLPSMACIMPFGRLIGIGIAGLLVLVILRAKRDEVAFLALGSAPLFAAPDLYPHYFLMPIVAAIPLATRGDWNLGMQRWSRWQLPDLHGRRRLWRRSRP